MGFYAQLVLEPLPIVLMTLNVARTKVPQLRCFLKVICKWWQELNNGVTRLMLLGFVLHLIADVSLVVQERFNFFFMVRRDCRRGCNPE